MKPTRRQEILDAAKALFNKRGFNGVSTRDIAGALGISKGNLTYYFKKKEDILEAILLEKPEPVPPKPPENLLELDAFFGQMQNLVQENSYYFWHHTQLAQLSPAIQERQEGVYQRNVNTLTVALKTLADNGLIRKEEHSGQYARLVDALLMTAIYWIPFCEVSRREPADPKRGMQRQEWSLLLPLLTDKGKNIVLEQIL
ncbi:TetR/AcrR family transcriptional regulator [Ruminococcaceae bacterium OttesenSCG-928-I18]|nr:TetR/AcrR family transcriptional regulator [Ruminococcaceae bacterium OttesenSCG-928-I18]